MYAQSVDSSASTGCPLNSIYGDCVQLWRNEIEEQLKKDRNSNTGF